MTALKPCPFCGSQVELSDPLSGFLPDEDYFNVFCQNCDTEWLIHGLKEGVIKNWNTRPLEDALQARIDVLESRLAAIHNAAVRLNFILVESSPDEGEEPQP